jgi:hypothetical protein
VGHHQGRRAGDIAQTTFRHRHLSKRRSPPPQVTGARPALPRRSALPRTSVTDAPLKGSIDASLARRPASRTRSIRRQAGSSEIEADRASRRPVSVREDRSRPHAEGSDVKPGPISAMSAAARKLFVRKGLPSSTRRSRSRGRRRRSERTSSPRSRPGTTVRCAGTSPRCRPSRW